MSQTSVCLLSMLPILVCLPSFMIGAWLEKRKEVRAEPAPVTNSRVETPEKIRGGEVEKTHEGDVRKMMQIAGQATPNFPKLLQEDEQTRQILEVAVSGMLTAFDDALAPLRQSPPKSGTDSAILALRMQLMVEELGETLRAMLEHDLEKIADGCADLEVVTVGTAIAYGIPHERVFSEVMRANLSKFHPCNCDSEPDCKTCGGSGWKVIRDERGKFLKPDGWKAPDLSFLR